MKSVCMQLTEHLPSQRHLICLHKITFVLLLKLRPVELSQGFLSPVTDKSGVALIVSVAPQVSLLGTDATSVPKLVHELFGEHGKGVWSSK